MTESKNDLGWTRPVIDSATQKEKKPNSENLTNAAWTSVAIGVVTKKILQNDAIAEYPFEAEDS